MMNLNLPAVKFSLAFGVGLLLVACGDDVTNVTQETSGLEIVATADSLGKCTAERSGEMKFAQKEGSVFVCSDSAWKNVSAAEKASCSAKLLSDSSGYKIVCDGDSVGVVFNGSDGKDGSNGAKGEDGKNGKNGEDGKDGSSCVVSPLSDSSGYKIVCNGDSVGVIFNGSDGSDGEDATGGCSLTDNGDGSVTQVCGKDSVRFYKAICGEKSYDPDKSFCYKDSVVSLCGGKTFDPAENFCSGASLYAFCGGKTFDPGTEFCFNDSIILLCNGKNYNPTSSFCFGDSVYAFCNGKTYDPRDSVCYKKRLYGFFEDARDRQVYRMVRIGEQVWMAENLNYAYREKTADLDSSSFCYKNSATSCKTYGRLYLWSAAMDSAAVFTENGKDCGNGAACSPADTVRGVCPAGWHLPDTTEWSALERFVADSLYSGNLDNVGMALKASTAYGSDNFGFGALMAGERAYTGKFSGFGNSTGFWSATYEDAKYTYERELRSRNSDLGYVLGFKYFAQSVRCIKD